MIALIVFDLDGTLVDSHKDLAYAANALVTELGGGPLSEEAVVRMVGEGAAVLVRRALTACGLDAGTPGALDRFLAIYDECLLNTTAPYDGTREMLEQVAPGRRLAVLTNKPSRATNRVLEGLGLATYFDPIVGGDTPFGRKPDPAGLRYVIETAGATPRTTVLVGDSPVDLQTARRAGTHVCLARFGFGYSFANADFEGSEAFLDSPSDLTRIVASFES
jgi:phosphoglycolate phosphatase